MNQRESLSKVLLACILLSGLFAIQPATDVTAQEHELSISSLLKEMNEDRMEFNLPPLRREPDLDRIARLKAEDMVRNSYFSHTSPQGLNPWHWFTQGNYEYVYAGENLALDFKTAAGAQEAWMASPKHRSNILNKNYEDIGYAIAEGKFTNINGVHKEREGIIIVQVFGKRMPGTVAARPLLSPAPIAEEKVKLGVLKIDVSSLSGKLAAVMLNTTAVKKNDSSETLAFVQGTSTSPAAWPIMSLGLIILIITAGFHTKVMV